MDYKIILGTIAVCVSIIASALYIRNIFRGTTKPHAFSWFIWGLILAIAFAASLTEGGGAGAWFTGVGSFTCLSIAVLAFAKGTRTFPLVDWLALFAAFISLFLWWLTKTPALSVVLVSITDAIGYIPTFRKGYALPYEETAFTYILDVLGFSLSIAALSAYNISTVLYPASVAITTSFFVLMLFIRRRQSVFRTTAN